MDGDFRDNRYLAILMLCGSISLKWLALVYGGYDIQYMSFHFNAVGIGTYLFTLLAKHVSMLHAIVYNFKEYNLYYFRYVNKSLKSINTKSKLQTLCTSSPSTTLALGHQV